MRFWRYTQREECDVTNIAVIVNTLAVILGSLFGTFMGGRIGDKIKVVLFQTVGLTTIAIGTKMTLQTNEYLIVLGSMALGGILGHVVGIEEKLGRLANVIEKSEGETRFVKGFVTASVLFLVGPMTILGCLNAGLKGDNELIFIKSLLDGISSAILASMYGIGVLMSALSVYIFQGLLVTFSGYLSFLSEGVFLKDFTGTGGLIILATGIRLLDVKDIKAGNFLPALFFSPLFDWIFMK